jgi:plastocyanin
MKKYRFALLAVFIALFLVACGGESDSEPQVDFVTLDVVQNDIYYGDTPDNADNPVVWTVPTGADVTVNLVNNGALEHNFAVVKLGETIPAVYNSETDSGILLTEGGLVAGGESATKTFTAPEPGEYTVICTVAGHYPSMQGRLVVTGG